MVDLLDARNIPFQICGGLAANAYGSDRDLHDIDLFVPGERFQAVVQAGEAYISKPAAHRQEEGWDLTYVQFIYEGIKVELGNADGPRILDAKAQTWVDLNIDFSRSQVITVLGLDVPVMNPEDLVRYKSLLARPVDLEDVRAIRQHKP